MTARTCQVPDCQQCADKAAHAPTCDQPHPNSAEHRCYLPAGHEGAHFATMFVAFGGDES